MVPASATIEGPRHPSAKDYPAFLRFLSASYGFKDPRWFENDTAFFFGKRPGQLRTKWVLKSGGRFATHVGVFPFTVFVGAKKLKVAGIGAVATHPDFRGQGLMKRLMKHVMREVSRGGYDLSVLWGEKALYEPHGYRRASPQEQFLISRGAFGKVPADTRVRPAAPRDYPEMDRLFSRHPFRTERTKDHYISLARRFQKGLPRAFWVLEEKGKIRSYVLILKRGRKELEAAEWGGDEAGVIGLFGAVLRRCSKTALFLSPYRGSGLSRWASRHCRKRFRSAGSFMVKTLGSRRSKQRAAKKSPSRWDGYWWKSDWI